VSVLVVEAGPLDAGEDAILVPGAYNPAPYFWPMVSVLQSALNNTVHLATCARVVRGGTTINAMIFLRGDVEDDKGWATLRNEGWSWDNLLPYFKKVCRRSLLCMWSF
jgi:choline dehydrogenase